ncbi:MAG: hypothetical protein HZB67_00900 [Candidatus Aenigmarchaeota archaeon]|nr:hypothetical protein [Candidatus Aenigmarchaeota archaeon]
MVDSVYISATKNKNLAAKILLPLIEFEFSVFSEESPILTQTEKNKKQFEAVYQICKNHGWTSKMSTKGANLVFRLNRDALEEIYSIAGPFADPKKNQWSELLFERRGKKGGFMADSKSTEEKIAQYLKKIRNWTSMRELCIKLRLMPSTLRESIRELEKKGLVVRKRDGRQILLKYVHCSTETSPGKTAE